MASMVLGTVGTMLLGPVGGFIGSAIGAAIDAYLFTPAPPDVKGPRIEDTRTSAAGPGTPIPIVHGADRVGCVVIGCTNLIETENTEKIKSGKKSYESTTYTYSVTCDLMLAEGPILGVGRIWADGKLIRGTRDDFEINSQTNRYKVGLFPYPDFYRIPERMYDPALLPWSLDPALHPNPSTQRWKMQGENLVLTSSSGDGNKGDVIYWRDEDTGYYLPVAATVAYSRENVITDEFGNPIDPDKEELYPSPFYEDPYSHLLLSETSHRHGEWTLQGLYPEHRDYPPTHWAYQLGCHTWDNAEQPEPNEHFTHYANNGLAMQAVSETTYNEDGSIRQHGTNYGFDEVIPAKTCGVSLVHEYRLGIINPETGEGFKRNRLVAYYFRTYDATVRSWDHYYNLHAALNDFSPMAVLQFQNPDNVTFYRGTDDQPPDPTMSLALGTEEAPMAVPGYVNRAHIVFDNLQLEDFGNRLPQFTFEVVRYEDETIKTSLVSLLRRAGVEEEFYDLSELPDSGLNSFLPGYTIATRTNFRKSIETLLDAFNIDVAEVGPKLVFRRSARSADHIIDYHDLAARDASGKEAPENFRTTRRDMLELPRTIETAFKDPAREYQNNTMRQQRGQVAVGNHMASVELPVVAYSYVMKAWAQSKLQDIWRQRVTTQVTLPHRYIYVSPSDIITVVSDEVVGVETRGGVEAEIYGSLEIRVSEVQRGVNGLLEITGVISNGARYPHTDTDYDQIDVPIDFVSEFERETTVFVYTELMILDIPSLDASHSDPGVYYAVSDRNSESWKGADLMVSNSADEGYEVLDRTSTASALGITVSGSMADVNPSYIDTESDIIVALRSSSATLTSVTLDQMLDLRANAALIGDEIVCFTNATYLGENRYRLNGAWLRGLRGTEDRTTHYAGGERFVLLDPATIRDAPRGMEENGTIDYFKAVSFGVRESATPYTMITYNANRMRPFSPVHVTGTRDASNNLTITWTRRDRLFFRWQDGVDLPMSEDKLAYQVDILVGGVVVRTIDCTTAQAIYSAADQTADGLTPGQPVTVNVYQMSAIVGRGHGAEETV